MACQILLTKLDCFFSKAYSSQQRRKHRSSTKFWPFAKGIHQRSVYSPSQRAYDDVIKWKYFPRYWPFVLGNHRSSVDSPHKGQWRGALMFSLICAWMNGWGNNREAGDLRRHRAHYDVTVMSTAETVSMSWCQQICCFRRATVANLKQ